jgi:hypothetical protein
MYEKTFICLANSRKNSGRCIAGRELINGLPGPWIRPISGRPGAEISEDDRRYENGLDPQVLDVITVRFIEPRPIAFQTENHLINDRFYWAFRRKATVEEALAAVDGMERPLWSNQDSSYNGVRDRVAEHLARPEDGSLRLIDVQDLEIHVVVEGAEFDNGKRRVRGRFTHGGVLHYLSITDPLVERHYLQGRNGRFPVGRALLCISLGEPYHGFTYKLIASIIT